MKVMVIGDIHGESIWKKFGDIEQLLQSNIFETEYDKYIFLGDYFDSFKISTNKILERFYDVVRLKNNYPDKVVLLIGNHELQYFLTPFHVRNNEYLCSGYRSEYHLNIKEFYDVNKHLFQCAYQEKNYLFTHAGISESWYKYVYQMSLEVEEREYTNYADLLNKEFYYRNPTLFAVGHTRGGSYSKGGPFWADKSETQYNPLIGIRQVVGHTHIREIETIKIDDSTEVNYIDCLQSRFPQPLILEI